MLAPRQGGVLAVERNSARALTMRCRCEQACAPVTVIESNFLHIDPSTEPFARIELVLLDPSCSGSGMERHLENSEEGALSWGSWSKEVDSDADRTSLEEKAESLQGAQQPNRLHVLAAVQLRLLLHALSFASARRVSYSTCSVHPIENEFVIAAAARDKAVRRAGWRLVPAMSRWPCGGLPIIDGMERCARTCPEWLTNGFFVALVERDTPAAP